MRQITMAATPTIARLLLLSSMLSIAAVALAESKTPQGFSRNASPCQRQLAEAAAEGRYTFVLFWKQDDAATRAMEDSLAAGVGQRGEQATWMKIRVNDPSEQGMVARFDATRSPMPTAMALAPNGAVTGVFPTKVEDKQIEGAILTPACSDMIKALQQQKIALVCLQRAGSTEVPQGVADFEADPHFAGRTHVTVVSADDPAEAKFFARLRGNRTAAGPLVAMFAPPGAHIGTYNGTITAAQLSKAIHDAGKCGPNCKHHHHHK
jgi:hypothetical protein